MELSSSPPGGVRLSHDATNRTGASGAPRILRGRQFAVAPRAGSPDRSTFSTCSGWTDSAAPSDGSDGSDGSEAIVVVADGSDGVRAQATAVSRGT